MRLVLIMLMSLLPFCATKDTVPTFLLDYDQVINYLFLEQNPFSRMSSQQFTEIVQDSIKQYAVVILFIEETFSTEDISTKDEKGTAYANLREYILKSKAMYIPNVENPVKVITSLLQPTEINVFVLKPKQLFHSTENMNYFYLFFNDDRNETRTNALRRHDLVIQHVYESTRKMAKGPVLAIYTGKVNPVVVATGERGHVHDDEIDSPIVKGIVLESQAALYRFVDLTINSGDRTRRTFYDENSPIPVGEPQVDKKTPEGQTSKVALGEYELEFFFIFESTRWRLDRIKLYESDEWISDHNLSTYIGAPYGSSYICDEPFVFYNSRDQGSLVIPEYQIQPFRLEDVYTNSSRRFDDLDDDPENVEYPDKISDGNNVNDVVPMQTQSNKPLFSDLKFGPAVICTPYFTIGIMTGLIVSFLCLTILMSGIFCLYHCETNDHFDDPQAKQIVIAAGE